MENASKALIMAGSILIGVIIMSIGVYVFSVYGGTSEQIQKQLNEKAIAEFNAHFTKYDGMKECTLHDIISLANFAKKYNEDLEVQNNISSDYHIKVQLKVGYTTTQLTIEQPEDLIKRLQDEETETTIDEEGNRNTHTKYYTGKILGYDVLGRVKGIQFE